MTTPYLTEMLAEQHRAELGREARTARLAALARCCSPRTWARIAHRAGENVARLRATVRRDRSAAACCTA
jgi:hypothetical protein